MQLVDNKAVSRGLVRVQPGEELLDALLSLAQVAGWREAFITGTGSFELIELADLGDSVTLENAALVNLSGHMRRADGKALLTLHASVVADGKLHHGRIAEAVSGAMLLMIEAVTPEASSRAAMTPNAMAQAPAAQAPAAAAPRASSGMRSAASASPASASPAVSSSPAQASPSVAAPVRAATPKGGGLVPPSQSFRGKPLMRRPTIRRNDADEHENPDVEVGDFLDHPQLGLCEVEGYDKSGGVRVRVSSGRLRVLRLDALHVLEGEVDAEGRNVFKITGPRRRR